MTTATRSDLAAPGNSDFSVLKTRFSGEIITPADAGYDDARILHDLGYDPHPAAIVRPRGTDDVAQALRFARAYGYPVAVRSGGHSIPGYSSVNGALVVDLASLNAIQIDPETRTARVQPGARSGELADAAHAHGLALSTGDTSSVGLGGLTLGGGIGWMVRKYGLAIDNLLSAQMVTAQGVVVRASATENAELFWGLRGGGGNFGIVTEFEYQLAPVDSVVAGAILLPATPEVIRGYLDYTPNAPEGLSTIAHLWHAPPAPFVPEELVGKLVFFVMVVFAGDPAEADEAIAPIRALGEVLVEAVGPMPYPAVYEMTEVAAAPHLAEVRMMFADDLSDGAIQGMIDSVDVAPSPISMVQLRGLGGAFGKVAPEETAFAHRERKLMVSVIAVWFDPAEDDVPHREWAETAWRKLQAEKAGAYSNFLANEGEARIRDAYPDSTYNRLAELKRIYDPENFFQLNQNIRPR